MRPNCMDGDVKFLNRYFRSETGSIAVPLAVSMTALVGVGGLAIDYGMLVQKTSELQILADGAAVAGASGYALAKSTEAQIVATATAFAKQKETSDGQVAVDVQTSNADTVAVSLTQKATPFFGKMLGQSEFTVTASATAKVVGASKICVLALDNSKAGALSLTGDAVLQANNCGAYSNSISATGLSSYKNSALNASLICSAGGVGGGTANFNPAPVVDCPATPDPLAGRPPPSTAGCDYVDLRTSSETRILSPGVYCGGLHVTGSSHVTFRPGVYVMKDGPLEVTHTSTITGENVGFYLTGDQAVFLFAGGSTVELTAPTDGPLAGLLFFEDRSNAAGRYHEIVSENARKLVGTIYLSKGNFAVSSKKPVADQSAYTAIVANTIQLNKYPVLVLNSDYELTDVPVPSGLGTKGGSVFLTK